jgi:DNA-binding response OmpR family regulator
MLALHMLGQHGSRGRIAVEVAMRVLVVEDEPPLARAVARGLRAEGMAVDIALDGGEALAKAAVCPYEVIVLDRDLPVVHGDEVCRQLIAGDGNGRVLMLTAAREITDRIDGLNLGADDYLAKPFAFGELVARVRALGRRAHPAHPPMLTRGDLAIDTVRRIAYRRGERLDLSKKELAVLEILLAADGAVVSAEELLDRAWDEFTDPFTNVVRMTMSKLRRRLGEPPVIQTVTGTGYRIP